eukprot:TRINITY_DN6580_c0_g1_i2.p1 TRINITY_DN6580_c0_g1~~TRINITY_DN6580_c0_g1_i2.p1  ORF type:complete len:717 (+),score=124.84 TRINITY_DN6580_c0_g1_i2:46-2196(+)
MATIDLGAVNASSEVQSSSNQETQPHHVIDLSNHGSPTASPTPDDGPSHENLPGHVIDLSTAKPPRTPHRDVQIDRETRDQAIQATEFDEQLLAELPSVQAMQQHIRPSTASEKVRRESKMKLRKRRKKSRVAPAEDLDLDEPSRLQNRENIRAQLSGIKLFLHDVRVWLEMQRSKRRDPIPIWRGPIKTIEGEFGSALTSFFVFLRWLFLLNASLAIVIGGVIVFPAVAFFDYSTQITAKFEWFNIFDGQGAVGQTWIFYGGYPSHLQGVYRLDLMYITTMVVVFIGCFFFIFNNIANAMGNVSTGGLVKTDTRYTFTTLTLMSWDYSFVKESGIENLRKGVRQALVETLAERRAKAEEAARETLPFKERAKLAGKRVAAWLIYMMLVAGAFTGVWFIVQNDNTEGEETIIDTYGPVVVFSFINGALPYPIKKLPGLLEHYTHPRTELQVTIFRTFMLRTLTIYALLYGFFTKYKLHEAQLPAWQADVVTPQEACAGTLIGQELWKLVVADTFVSVIQRFMSTLFFYKLYKRRIQLEVVQSVLGLVYRQGLIWVGMVFCPALPLLAMVSNVVYFWFYFKLVRRFCRPPDKRFTQNRNNTFFMFCLALTLIFVAIPVAWALKVYNPNCGPYGAPRYNSPFDGIWEWMKDQNNDFQQFVDALIDPVTVCSLFLIIVVYIRVLKIRQRQKDGKLAELRDELKGLRQDKRFLLAKSSQA